MKTLYKPTGRDYVFFWHEEDTNGRFSQGHVSPFTVDGVRYRNCEQYVMAEKARLFHDREMYERILDEEDPVVCRALGKQVRNFDRGVWEKHLESVVYRGNMAKFSQNRGLKNALLATGDAMLVQANPADPILGIGMTAFCPDAMDPRRWRGENLLGKTLMRVRSRLRQENGLQNLLETA